MERYIIDLKTGWKYELVGDYYLPIGTRFEIADQATTEDGRHTENTAAISAALARTTPNIPAADPGAQMSDHPVIGRFGRAHAAFLKRTQRPDRRTGHHQPCPIDPPNGRARGRHRESQSQ